MRSYIFSVFYSWGTLILQHRQQGIILWLLFFVCFVLFLSVWYESVFSRKIEPVWGIFDLLQGIGSRDYGDWEVPWLATYKLGTQESWWCSSEHLRDAGLSTSWREMLEVLAQTSRIWIPASRPFWFIQAFNGLSDIYSLWGGQCAFLNLIIQIPVQSGAAPQMHPEIMFNPGALCPREVSIWS